jgi:hypothetical protein
MEVVSLCKTIGMIRRFDWPACFQVFSNRPDKSPQVKPRRSRTHRSFQNRAQLRRRPFMPLPTCSVSLPVSERPVSVPIIMQFDTFNRTEFLAAFWNVKALIFG